MTFVVIDGTDGAGKGTQTKLLEERLLREGFGVFIADFPRYGHDSGRLIKQYLNGLFGCDPKDVPAKVASGLYAFDRFMGAPEIRMHQERGDVVIANRYVSANKGHQLGKIKGLSEREEFLSWLDHLEYVENGIPKEDLNILLYVPPEVSQCLVDQKDVRGYTDKKRDIHEGDYRHLQDAAEAFLYVARKEGWHVIMCAPRGQMLPREVVHERVYEAVRPLLLRHGRNA